METKVFLLLPFSFFSCYTKKGIKNITQDKNEIRCIKITRQFPIIDTNGTILRYSPNVTKIFYYNNQILYQTYNYYAKLTSEEEVNSSDFKIVHYNFAYTQGKARGILYDSLRLIKYRFVRVDSMLSKEWAATINFNFLFNENNTKLIQTKQPTPFEKEDLYSCINKKDTSMKGEILLTFSKNKLQDLNYTFSRELDSLNEMKLFKVTMINYARFIEGTGFHIDRIEVPWILEEIPVEDKDRILKFFKLEEETKYPDG